MKNDFLLWLYYILSVLSGVTCSLMIRGICDGSEMAILEWAVVIFFWLFIFTTYKHIILYNNKGKQ